MKQLFLKIAALSLALLLLAGCAGEKTESRSDETAEEPVPADGQTVQPEGEALGTTYAADDVFSLNVLFDSSFNP